MSVRDLLLRARRRITDPTRWTQRVMARDETGFTVAATAAEACSWCAFGSLLAERADGGFTEEEVLSAAVMVGNAWGGNIVEANDTGGHDEVLAAFDDAAAAVYDPAEHEGEQG